MAVWLRQRAWMRDHLLNRITETEYDLTGRPRRIKAHENGQHVYTGEVTYDASGSPSLME